MINNLRSPNMVTITAIQDEFDRIKLRLILVSGINGFILGALLGFICCVNI